MAIKVTKRTTPEGPRYSISGLTYGQLFRIKHAMLHEEERLEGIIVNELAEHPRMQEEFQEFKHDAHDVFVAVCNGCF